MSEILDTGPISYGPGPLYRVGASYFDDDGYENIEAFEGPSVYTRAYAHFEKLKADPDACEVELTRLDAGEWKLVAREKRDVSGGAWRDIINDTD
jgi:hypothetical protein